MKKYLIFMIILLMICIPINAAIIDVDKLCSLNLVFKYDNNNINNMNTKIYKVANIDASGYFTYRTEFMSMDEPINGLTTSEQKSLSYILMDYIAYYGIEPLYEEKTRDGLISLSDISTGVYLVVVDDLEEGNDTYYASPSIIPIPIPEYKDFKYDLEIDIKIDKNTIIPEPTETDNPVEPVIEPSEPSPRTYDDIMMYFPIFVISCIGISVIVYMLLKNNKDKKTSNDV